MLASHYVAVPRVARGARRIYVPRLARPGLGASGTLAGQGCGAPMLSSAQLQALAVGAGFPPSLAPQMAAIALRESGGCPTAYNPVAPDNSYGLWQINILGNPGLLDALGLTDPTQLFDPATNAAAAAYLYGGNAANINTAWAATSGGLPGLPSPAMTAADLAPYLPAAVTSDIASLDPTTLTLGAVALGLFLAAAFG
jgi:Lysozyme like domain